MVHLSETRRKLILPMLSQFKKLAYPENKKVQTVLNGVYPAPYTVRGFQQDYVVINVVLEEGSSSGDPRHTRPHHYHSVSQYISEDR